MSKPDTSSSISQATLKNGLILGLFALVSTGLIAMVHFVTKDKITQEVEDAMVRRLNQIVPANEYDNQAYRDCLQVQNNELDSSQTQKIFRMRKNDSPYAVFLTAVAPNGYSGKISLVIGIYHDGRIAGVRVTEHQETPGLGDKIEIEKSDWITQFEGKSLQSLDNEDWKVKKDGGEFDALTGATITPRAIIDAVYRALNFYETNKSAIFQSAANCGTQS